MRAHSSCTLHQRTFFFRLGTSRRVSTSARHRETVSAAPPTQRALARKASSSGTPTRAVSAALRGHATPEHKERHPSDHPTEAASGTLQSHIANVARQGVCKLHLLGQAATCAVRCRHPVYLHLCTQLLSGSALRPQRASCTPPAVSPLSALVPGLPMLSLQTAKRLAAKRRCTACP